MTRTLAAENAEPRSLLEAVAQELERLACQRRDEESQRPLLVRAPLEVRQQMQP